MTRALSSLAFGALALGLVACGSETASLPTHFGTILLESNSGVEPAQQATGYFYRYESTPVSDKCFVSEELDACRVWKCDDYSPLAIGDTVPVSAGPISVTGTRVEVGLEEGEPGTYVSASPLDTPLWAGGERLRVSVAGSADFPASSIGVLAPELITLTAPTVAEPPLLVEASSDLVFGWPATQNSDVFVVLSVAVPDPEGGENVLYPGVDCGFLGTAGVGVVPKSVLAKVPKPDGIAGHQLEALTFASNAIRIDDAVLTFQATSFALSTLATIE